MLLHSLVLGLFFLSAVLSAQSTDATLSGSVTDPGGLPVAGSRVTALNVKTGVSTSAEANAAGIYRFGALHPGVYKVSAEHEGFRRLVFSDVVLEVGAKVDLNLSLEIGAVTQSVEVKAQAEGALGYNTASVGGMVTGQKVLDLPLIGRNALSLTYIHAGLVGDNFNGARIGTLNITLDGVNMQDQRINGGVSTPIFISTDQIEEFRVITAPADVEMRGSGQIQMMSRTGTNSFHGSLFETHRNTILNANTWFNNARGSDAAGNPISPRNILIQNQFGGRVGGPIIRNRTFFHFTYDAQRQRTSGAVTDTVYTATARQGVFRFFPGIQNANTDAARPTVDLSGNPVRPSTATGDLQSVSLLGRDPNRLAMDPSGFMKRFIDLMPLPNNFRTGDGLNTAGYTWSRGAGDDRDQYSIRIDHNITNAHRLSGSYTHEGRGQLNGFLAQPYPTSQGGDVKRGGPVFLAQLVSTLSPRVLNEFRYGAQRGLFRFRAPWEVGGVDVLPKAGGQPYVPVTTLVTDIINASNDPQGRVSPFYEFVDYLSWQKGKHAFKWGAELRFVSTNGFNSFDVMPRANFGVGGAPSQNISTITDIGQNQTAAINLLSDLSGSLGSVRQAFNSPGGSNPQFLSGEGKQRTWQQRQLAFFYKDDWKVSPHMTINLGIRWDWIGVPYDKNGKGAGVVGGSAGLFGLSGKSFADLFRPGTLPGSLTDVELVGKNSPNAGRKLFNDDYNNFSPAVGVTWALPGGGGLLGKLLGNRKTVIRAGYGWGYERNSMRIVDVVAGDQPGLRSVTLFQTGSYLDLSRMRLPLAPLDKPLTTVPITDRTQTVRAFDTNLPTPYVQNWNFSIQRALPKSLVLDVRYVGNKGTKLWRGTNINETNIFENGILDAFRTTQGGGNSPLLDRIFQGLTLAGLGTVNGTSITGSDLVRANTTTQAFLAGNNPGGFANYLNTNTQFTGVVGGLLRRAGLPENFVFANPQYAGANLTSAFANSTYHSLQVEVTRRFGSGWTLQSNYTWSKALGEEEGSGQEQLDSYRTIRNRSFDKRLMSFHLTHAFRNNVLWELPFGPNRKFFGGARGWAARMIERWQVSAIYNIFSGSPISLGSAATSYNNFGDNTPDVIGSFDKGFGHAKIDGNTVVYFQGLTQVTDPSVAGITTKAGLQGRSTLKAIADASGRIILVNPLPGTLGSLGHRFLEGPGSFRLDMNIVKRIRIREQMNLEMRLDSTNIFNTPIWGDPSTANSDINSTNFGRITTLGDNPRIVQVGLRLNF